MRRRSLPTIALAVLTVLAGCQSPTAEVRQSLADLQDDSFGFESYERVYYDNVMQTRFEGLAKTVVEANLYLPQTTNAEPLPAVILVHGSGGRGAREARYAKALNEAGIAAAAPDSFGPRGIRTTGKRQEQIGSATMLGDAFALLGLLATHPRIDASRIAIVGFSKGGTVAMHAADERISRGLAPDGRRFAAHVAFYPGCVVKLKRVEPTGAPLLVLLGARDSYTPAVKCERFIARMRTAALPVESITYPGAEHAWDANYPVRRSNFDFSYGNCDAEVHDDGRTSDGKTGTFVDERDKAAVRAWIKSCGVPGVTTGRNQAAKEQSLADLLAFLRDKLLE